MADDLVMGQGTESVEAIPNVDDMPPGFRRGYYEKESFRATSYTPAGTIIVGANLKARGSTLWSFYTQ